MKKKRANAAGTLSDFAAIFLILLGTGCLLLFLTQFITLQSLPDALIWITSHPAAAVISSAAFWVVSLMIYGIGGKMFLSFSSRLCLC